MIKGTTGGVAERVSIRSVLRGAEVPRKRRRSRRRSKVLVGWLLYCCTAVGGTAAAFTVRDTLFPSLGGPTTRSLWISATPETTSATNGSSTVSDKDGADSVANTVASSADDQTPSTGSLPGDDATTSSSPDDNGSNKGPQTGTTVANPNGNGTTVTTVDDAGAANSSTPTSASTPSSAPDPESGKGKGSGGGGGGGGGSDTSTP